MLSTDQSCLAQVVHYLFLPWNIPWIILACYGNQQQKNNKKTTKKKKKEAINNTQIRRRCMWHLIRTYTVWEFIYRIWDRQTVLIKTKKKRKKTGAFKRCILLSLSVKRPLIFWTRRLHLDVLQSQCIHTCHTNYIRLPLLMIRVNRLFIAQRSVKCWFFDDVWIMT